MIDFRHVKGHIEAYNNGEFIFSADNMDEALSEAKEFENTTEGCVAYERPAPRIWGMPCVR